VRAGTLVVTVQKGEAGRPTMPVYWWSFLPTHTQSSGQRQSSGTARGCPAHPTLGGVGQGLC